ncbi:ABC transporter ATP-binding protein [Reinekea marinisedimentorum]|uniref:Iron(III) transport system ATP-binding protein n=1 Tax=Reinekea marinisedimentorum TaxID=230495 RepID=A0A4R3I9V9_9GAMM|nr:ABC transporter ATP-binding protein [Reinekea marinisedimentorum]TCS42668.1 iron(III) transport system ATP-binding protein [Reinekea marinisedimentorum]
MPIKELNNKSLTINDVSIRYGDNEVVTRLNMQLKAGEIGCLLGASGCGKSTLLRAISGFGDLAEGRILLGERLLSERGYTMPAEQRKVGLVFQDVALFPHLSVEQNIAFGIGALRRAEQQSRVAELLAAVGLSGYEKRYPNSLSGGQQQRIALARALAPRPDLLLLDEPFSGLDTMLRDSLLTEVRNILLEQQITALFVTHDQMEAFTLADKVALMHNGAIEQLATPYDMYHKPKTRYVADFIGKGYFIPAEVLASHQINTELGVLNTGFTLSQPEGASMSLLLRPDDIVHDDQSNYQAVITGKQFRGSYFQYDVELSNGRSLVCLASSHHNHAIGQRIGIKMELEHIVLFEN